jgi:hypothetical protein
VFFLIQSAIVFTSAVSPDAFFNNFTALQSVYMISEWVCSLAIILVFKRTFFSPTPPKTLQSLPFHFCDFFFFFF